MHLGRNRRWVPLVSTIFVPRILFQVSSTSVTINLRSNLVCGVVIKGQETFTLMAVFIVENCWRRVVFS